MSAHWLPASIGVLRFRRFLCMWDPVLEFTFVVNICFTPDTGYAKGALLTRKSVCRWNLNVDTNSWSYFEIPYEGSYQRHKAFGRSGIRSPCTDKFYIIIAEYSLSHARRWIPKNFSLRYPQPDLLRLSRILSGCGPRCMPWLRENAGGIWLAKRDER